MEKVNKTFFYLRCICFDVAIYLNHLRTVAQCSYPTCNQILRKKIRVKDVLYYLLPCVIGINFKELTHFMREIRNMPFLMPLNMLLKRGSVMRYLISILFKNFPLDRSLKSQSSFVLRDGLPFFARNRRASIMQLNTLFQ